MGQMWWASILRAPFCGANNNWSLYFALENSAKGEKVCWEEVLRSNVKSNFLGSSCWIIAGIATQMHRWKTHHTTYSNGKNKLRPSKGRKFLSWSLDLSLKLLNQMYFCYFVLQKKLLSNIIMVLQERGLGKPNTLISFLPFKECTIFGSV